MKELTDAAGMYFSICYLTHGPDKNTNLFLSLGTYWNRVFLSKLDVFTALCFTGTVEPLAAERMRILPMTQHADNIWNKGKFLPLFTDHRRC
jgi:hypothetical protein